VPKVGASNTAASTVAALVDGIDLGTPIMGSGWMAQKGLTAQPQNHVSGLLGEAVGGVAPMLAAAKATNIIEGLLALAKRGKSAINTVANDLQSFRKTGRMAGPPAVPQRSFSSDYSTGTGQPNGSRIALDIDGAALSPTATIAGRSTVGEANQGLRGAGLESAIEALGARIGPGTSSTLGKDLGRVITGRVALICWGNFVMATCWV
jgi:hypothetical protein